MSFRKLRIAWSVAWGIVALLLCVLWARSYWWVDQIIVRETKAFLVGVASLPGAFGIGIGENTRPDPISSSMATVDWLEVGGYPSRIWGMFALQELGFISPYWFLILVAVVGTIAPWRRELPWRFSLRTLLIATTLVAVVLGTIIYVVR